jgi:hypothetical protein
MSIKIYEYSQFGRRQYSSSIAKAPGDANSRSIATAPGDTNFMKLKINLKAVMQ